LSFSKSSRCARARTVLPPHWHSGSKQTSSSLASTSCTLPDSVNRASERVLHGATSMCNLIKTVKGCENSDNSKMLSTTIYGIVDRYESSLTCQPFFSPFRLPERLEIVSELKTTFLIFSLMLQTFISPSFLRSGEKCNISKLAPHSMAELEKFHRTTRNLLRKHFFAFSSSDSTDMNFPSFRERKESEK
jgi:hypothetical protein